MASTTQSAAARGHSRNALLRRCRSAQVTRSALSGAPLAPARFLGPSLHRSSHPTGRASESEGYVRAGVYRCSSPDNLISSSPTINKVLDIFGCASTPPGRYPCGSRSAPPRRHSPMNLTARQFTPAIDAAIYRPDSTLYQLQPSFHTHSTEPEPTARARRAGEEFY